jgi:hypothetical protein
MIFPVASVSRPALKPTQRPTQWIAGVKRGCCATLTTHPFVVPRSRMSRSYTFSFFWRMHGMLYYFFSTATDNHLASVRRYKNASFKYAIRYDTIPIPPNVVVEWLTLLLRNGQFQGSIFGLGDLLSWLRFFVVFLVSPGDWRDSAFKLGHDRFLSNHFQFIIIHLSSYHRHDTVYLLKYRR